MVDFHSHILPGIDDGSASVQESIMMLQMEKEQGIEHVIATPHFYPRYDKPEAFLSRRDAAEEQLRKEMEKNPDLPRISVGAEVYFFHGISESEYLPQLAVHGHNCILIEMPFSRWIESMYRELTQIHERWGIVPIIAHIDRYVRPWHAQHTLRKLESLPVMVQANAGSFLDRGRKGLAMRMLKQGHIQLLGSDCHNAKERAPNLGEAIACIQKQIGDDMVERLQENSKSLQIAQNEIAK